MKFYYFVKVKPTKFDLGINTGWSNEDVTQISQKQEDNMLKFLSQFVSFCLNYMMSAASDEIELKIQLKRIEVAFGSQF